MTDRFNALAALVSSAAMRWPAQALARFHAMFKDEALVIDKWFCAAGRRAATAAATSCRWSSSS